MIYLLQIKNLYVIKLKTLKSFMILGPRIQSSTAHCSTTTTILSQIIVIIKNNQSLAYQHSIHNDVPLSGMITTYVPVDLKSSQWQNTTATLLYSLHCIINVYITVSLRWPAKEHRPTTMQQQVHSFHVYNYHCRQNNDDGGKT